MVLHMSMLSEYFIINFIHYSLIHYLFSPGNINDEKVPEKDGEKVEGKSKEK